MKEHPNTEKTSEKVSEVVRLAQEQAERMQNELARHVNNIEDAQQQVRQLANEHNEDIAASLEQHMEETNRIFAVLIGNALNQINRNALQGGVLFGHLNAEDRQNNVEPQDDLSEENASNEITNNEEENRNRNPSDD